MPATLRLTREWVQRELVRQRVRAERHRERAAVFRAACCGSYADNEEFFARQAEAEVVRLAALLAGGAS